MFIRPLDGSAPERLLPARPLSLMCALMVVASGGCAGKGIDAEGTPTETGTGSDTGTDTSADTGMDTGDSSPADVDADGSAVGDDCDDGDPGVHPGASEIWYDGVDQDCDGADDYDQDGDGYDGAADGSGVDCDDTVAEVHPGASETWYDGVDQDCDGADDYDQDGDGYDGAADGSGADCDDVDASSYPGAGSCVTADDCSTDSSWVQVPVDHATIQGAIDASASGDRICVAAGTYTEVIDFDGKDLVIQSTTGSLATTIDGAGGGPVVALTRGETIAATLKGFTVTGGYATNGGGIYVSSSGVTLDDVVVLANEGSYLGSGVAAESSDLVLTNVDLIDNFGSTYGGGAFFRYSTVDWAGGTVSETRRTAMVVASIFTMTPVGPSPTSTSSAITRTAPAPEQPAAVR